MDHTKKSEHTHSHETHDGHGDHCKHHHAEHHGKHDEKHPHRSTQTQESEKKLETEDKKTT